MYDPTPIKNHENIVLNIISADAKIGRAFNVKGRPNVPESIEKFGHWIKTKKMEMSFSSYNEKPPIHSGVQKIRAYFTFSNTQFSHVK